MSKSKKVHKSHKHVRHKHHKSHKHVRHKHTYNMQGTRPQGTRGGRVPQYVTHEGSQFSTLLPNNLDFKQH